MSNQPFPPDPADQPIRNQQAYGDSVRSSDGGTYAESQYQGHVDAMGNRIESHEQVFEDKNLSRANNSYWIATVTYFVLAVLEIILVLRLIFRLLGANTDNGFISFLYGLSHFFVVPFNGIFNDQALGHSVFELSTLIAMLVYALIAWGIVSLGRVIF
ncbi:MAG: YggT family protein, partial [Chloroflexota bacterium]|nr:YggT family protein [Chloroflexota bacterium]